MMDGGRDASAESGILSPRSSPSTLYYRHSGRYSARGLATAVAIATPVGVLAAFVYAYLILYIPLAGIISVFLAAGRQ